jgi:glycosyltransferase involved in cell wall biosynthesis
VQGENGILVPLADSKALAEAIMALYANPEKRKEMGERGREKALAYSSETMLNKINRLYESFAGL